MRELGPGLALTAGVATVALAVAAVLPEVVPAVLVAVVLGLAIATARPLPPRFAPGVKLAATRVLQVGVALLGARLTVADLVAVGPGRAALVVATMTTAFLTVAVVGRLAGVGSDLRLLLATGTAVCGNSAIAAVAPVLQARERDVSYAVGTITTFGTIALLTYPLVAGALGLSDEVAGLWVGLAINDTSQVVAAGAAVSPEALETATVVKLLRNAAMAPLLVGIGMWASRRRGRGPDGDEARPGLGRAIRTAVPGFVIAFLALVVARSVGLVDARVADVLTGLSAVAITVALAAVGLRTDLRTLLQVGATPLVVGFVAAAVLALVALGLAVITVP